MTNVCFDKTPIIIYYCGGLKHTGKPIIVKMNGKEKNTDLVQMKNVNIKIKYRNSTGSAKRYGATTVLEVYKND